MLASKGTRCAKRWQAASSLGCAQGLGEQRIDAAGQVGLGALERGVQALDRQRVGARQDQGVGAAPRVQRRAQLAAHLGRGHHGLAVQVTTTFGETLVLELDHRRTRTLEGAHRALRVQRVAEAGVGVDDDRHAHTLGDAGQRLFDLGAAHQPHVGAAQQGVGDRRTRQVQRLEAGLRRHQGAERVIDTGRQQRARFRQALLQLRRVHVFLPRKATAVRAAM
jgi:hypothetical protein